MGERIDRERSRARIERDIETLAGPDYTLSDERDLPLRLHATCTATRSPTSPPSSSASDSRVWQDPVGTLIASNVAPGRARVRRRVALRLQPQRRQVRRHARRLHGARGLPPGRRGRRGAPAAADLVPRGGGLRLRPDAARLAHHAAAGHRGGAARDDPRRAWRLVLGLRRGRRLRAGALARVDPRARRPDRLGRGAHRAGPRPAGHRQRASASSRRSSATSTATCTSRGRADHAGATPMDFRLDAAVARRRDDRRAGAARQRARRRRRRHGRRDRGAAGPDQRHPRRRARLARPALGVATCTASCATGSSRSRASAARPAASASSSSQRQELPVQPMDAGVVGALARERGGERRDVPADALGRRPRHAVRGLAGAERDGLRAVRRRPLAHAARAGRPGRRGARRRGRLQRDPADGELSAVPPLGRVGIWSSAFALAPAAELRAAAAEIEELGFGALWFPEGFGTRESLSTAALVLAATERVPVCTGIANIWARDAGRVGDRRRVR